ncbi:MAG: heme NO-binding domain-containing protein, partial [Paracoccaceae bacterium]|nr:heme NO-binding domain-containing protein [Paracoccaceae bacterium]
MLGLINRSIECFLRDTYGDKTWGRVASQTGVTRFEVLLSYDDHLTELLLDQAQSVLAKDRSQLLEDLGTYIVAHPKQESVRRLMRFGGA